MDWTLVFDPYLPAALLIAAGAFTAVLAGIALWKRAHGGLARLAALSVLILIAANPSRQEAERTPINDVAVIVADESESQGLKSRRAETEATVRDLQERLAELGTIDTVVVRARPTAGTIAEDAGTRLFEALNRATADIAPERIGATFLVTDGQVTDIPESAEALGIDRPVHALITGQDGEKDRRLVIDKAPVYGIVGDPVEIGVRIEDYGVPAGQRSAEVTIKVDGALAARDIAQVGQDNTLRFRVPHGGQNVIEIDVAPLEGELTELNNRAVIALNGVRDRLRVLLVSGEPHAGERVWRNLLKADPSVDLVHFTILRPMEKFINDRTPPEELALIRFPKQELFALKLHEFDLVIFDRYQRRGVIEAHYLRNIADYVEKGGALLSAAGPDFAEPIVSLYETALSRVLPAQPTNRIIEEGYRPEVTLAGQRHPVTAALPRAGDGTDAPDWGRWFRLIETNADRGQQLMTGPDGKPLLVLDRVGRGRVAQLLSDHAWLWARGFEGGGPQSELLRRLAHWLMQEPELEEEDLRGSVQGQTLTITRRTMADSAAPVTVTRPDGTTATVTPRQDGPGRFTAQLPADQLGLYRLQSDEHFAVAAVGPINPVEFADVRATPEKLAPFVAQTGGGTARVAGDTPGEVSLPRLRHLRPGRDMAGDGWLGVTANENSVIRSLRQEPLLPLWLALLLGVGALLIAWWREGR